jgi:hypothetical protein
MHRLFAAGLPALACTIFVCSTCPALSEPPALPEKALQSAVCQNNPSPIQQEFCKDVMAMSPSGVGGNDHGPIDDCIPANGVEFEHLSADAPVIQNTETDATADGYHQIEVRTPQLIRVHVRTHKHGANNAVIWVQLHVKLQQIGSPNGPWPSPLATCVEYHE